MTLSDQSKIQNPKSKIAAAALVLCLAAATPAAATDAVSLLRRGDRAERVIRYSGTKVIWAAGADHGQKSPDYQRTARIWHDGPGRTRLQILCPDGTPARVVVENPSGRWFYSTKQHAWRPVAWRPPESRLDLLLRNYRVRRGPVETIAGRRALQVRIEPRFPGNPRKEAWLDLATGITLRADLYDRSGRLVSRSQFLEFVPQRALAASLFEVPLANPPASQVIAAGQGGPHRFGLRPTGSGWSPVTGISEPRLTFEPALPHYLPRGYVLDREVRTHGEGNEMVRTLFTDGLNTVALVEWRGPREPRDGGRERFWGPGDRIRWDIGPIHALLSGDLDAGELKRIAGSVGLPHTPPDALVTRK